MSPADRISIPGTQPNPIPDSEPIGPSEPHERLEVTLQLHAHKPSGRQPSIEELSTQPPKDRHYLSSEEYERAYGITSGDIDLVKAFARQYGLAIDAIDIARRAIILSGTVNEFNAAFDITLKSYKSKSGIYRSYTGTIRVPPDIAPIIEGIFGLDNRPQAGRR